jgi:hypothetical protein
MARLGVALTIGPFGQPAALCLHVMSHPWADASHNYAFVAPAYCFAFDFRACEAVWLGARLSFGTPRRRRCRASCAGHRPVPVSLLVPAAAG